MTQTFTFVKSFQQFQCNDEIGDGEEDKTIEPFAGLHKTEEHKITVTAIYCEWFTFLVTHMIILNNDNISYILLNLIAINVV